jgi:hypothetical protein
VSQYTPQPAQAGHTQDRVKKVGENPLAQGRPRSLI